MGSLHAEMGLTAKRVFLDKEGGIIEVRAAHTEDKATREAVRQELQTEARSHSLKPATPAMDEHKNDIRYKYEKTNRGGRIRIVTNNQDALKAVQEFLRTQMNQS